jgi:hypothetical protein
MSSHPNGTGLTTTITLSLDPKEIEGITRSEREAFSQILTDLQGAAESIARAGGRWVGLSKPTRTRILKEVPSTWRTFLNRLSLVGEGHLHPQLYSASSIAARYLGRLPMPEQTRFLRELIPTVVVRENGRRDVRNLDVEDMSDGTRRQVFAKVGDTVVVRGIPEQNAYLDLLERRRTRQEEQELGNVDIINRPGRWKIEQGKVYVTKEKAAGGLTLRDVKQILKDLTD